MSATGDLHVFRGQTREEASLSGCASSGDGRVSQTVWHHHVTQSTRLAVSSGRGTRFAVLPHLESQHDGVGDLRGVWQRHGL